MTKEKITRLTKEIKDIIDRECSDDSDFEFGDGLIFACHLRIRGTDQVLTEMATVGCPVGIASALVRSTGKMMGPVLKLLKDPHLHVAEAVKIYIQVERELKEKTKGNNFSNN